MDQGDPQVAAPVNAATCVRFMRVSGACVCQVGGCVRWVHVSRSCVCQGRACVWVVCVSGCVRVPGACTSVQKAIQGSNAVYA
eukprot:364001-Chlamydomonas_euryale.AAC.6